MSSYKQLEEQNMVYAQEIIMLKQQLKESNVVDTNAMLMLITAQKKQRN